MSAGKTIAELAAEAFEANERVRMHAMANVPREYEARKKSAIAYAEAQAAAVLAQKALDEAIRNIATTK